MTFSAKNTEAQERLKKIEEEEAKKLVTVPDHKRHSGKRTIDYSGLDVVENVIDPQEVLDAPEDYVLVGEDITTDSSMDAQLQRPCSHGGHSRMTPGELLTLETVYEIEHIFAKKRQEVDKTFSSSKFLELLGNKALLEKKINIRASDYRCSDKKKYYQGYTTARGQVKPATKVKELITLSNTKADYTETDIKTRNANILTGFVEYLKVNNLLIN